MMILLTVVGGSGLVVASGSDGSEVTLSAKYEEVEAGKSPSGSKPQLHYSPEDGIVGGPMPFFWKGEYHLFYLGRGGRRHIVSEDLVNWKELPIASSSQKETIAGRYNTSTSRTALEYRINTAPMK